MAFNVEPCKRGDLIKTSASGSIHCGIIAKKALCDNIIDVMVVRDNWAIYRSVSEISGSISFKITSLISGVK